MTLRGRLLALWAGSLVGLALLLAVYLPDRIDQQSRHWVESRSLGIAVVLAKACEAPLDFEDGEAAQRALSGLAVSRGARWALLVRPGGSTLAAWGPAPEAAESGPPGVDSSLGGIRVRVPVVARGGTGALLVAFGPEELEERRREARTTVFGASALVLVVGLLAAWAVGTLAVRPLQRVTRVAGSIAQGDDRARSSLELLRKDEVGALARAIDRMLGSLFEQRQRLGEANGELGRRLEELRRAQEQLIVSDRRNAVGRLAAGVAHEINNPLAYIDSNLRFASDAAGHVDALLATAAPNPAEARRVLAHLRPALGDALKGAEKAARIVKGLKTYSRDDGDRRDLLSITEPLDAALEMVGHEIRQRARLERDIRVTPRVFGNDVRICQVFLNLLVNASQAIPEGAPAEHRVRVAAFTDEAGMAVVEVADSGCGIPAEIQSRIFDPFFTTKPVGVGTGLGLSISHGIVSALGGSIEVESGSGAGSLFRVRLPPARGDELGPRPHPTRAPGPARRARLLVVDDEPMVGAGIVRVLPEHDVIAVGSGREALALLEAGLEFDRILCDVVMPEMDGAAFRSWLAAAKPELLSRVTFMTGGAFTENTEAFLASLGGNYLEKPIPVDRLRRLLEPPEGSRAASPEVEREAVVSPPGPEA